MLAAYTENFTHLFRMYKINPGPEYAECKERLELILNELSYRNELLNKLPDNSNEPLSTA